MKYNARTTKDTKVHKEASPPIVTARLKLIPVWRDHRRNYGLQITIGQQLVLSTKLNGKDDFHA